MEKRLLLVETKTNLSIIIIIIIIVYLAKSTSSSKAPPASFGIPTLLSLAVLLNRIDSRRWSSFISQSIRNIISIKLQNVPLLSVCCVLRCFPHSCTPLVSRFAPPLSMEETYRGCSYYYEASRRITTSPLRPFWVICEFAVIPQETEIKRLHTILNDKDSPQLIPIHSPSDEWFQANDK